MQLAMRAGIELVLLLGGSSALEHCPAGLVVPSVEYANVFQTGSAYTLINRYGKRRS